MTLKEYLQSLIDNKETDVEKLQKALIEATGAIDEAVETANYALTKLAAERRKSKRLEGTLQYILAQVKANHPGVLQVVLANAEMALSDFDAKIAIRALGEKE